MGISEHAADMRTQAAAVHAAAFGTGWTPRAVADALETVRLLTDALGLLALRAEAEPGPEAVPPRRRRHGGSRGDRRGGRRRGSSRGTGGAPLRACAPGLPA